MATYTPDIGLEVHAELNTKTKVFCGSLTAAGAPPNTQVCPICLGFPGVLPMLNHQVVEYGLRLALALNCEITRPSIFERKGYYYPDLPKNFQISQKRAPLGRNGFIEFTVDTRVTRVRISDVHIEEDAAKLIHPEDDPDHSLVDFNRAGVPLLEIVSEPDMHSVEEVEAYMSEIRTDLLRLGISEARMEMGQLRFEASISVRPGGATELGTRVEVKNLNSFRAVSRAVAYEIERQTAALDAGETLTQETRLWDEGALRTHPMRTKETAMDYRYFPEPDLTPLEVDQAWIDRVKAELPRLAEEERRWLMAEEGASPQEARTISADKELGDAHRALREKGLPAKRSFRWLLGPVLQRRNELPEEHPGLTAYFNADVVVDLDKYVEQGTVSGTAARGYYPRILESGKTVGEFVQEQGTQISDEAQLSATVDEVLKENPDAVANFRGGNEKSIGFLVGQVMRKSGRRANPQLVNQLLREKLKG